MNAALRCEDPVVVLEHVDLYNSTGPGPVDDYDYGLPVGRAAVRRTGAEVTVVVVPVDGRPRRSPRSTRPASTPR